jgi:signal transduction histidine kinase
MSDMFELLHQQPAHLLIVDDDPTILIFLEHTLSAYYQVTALGDSQEALALLGEQAFDLVVSDIQMPRYSGFDLLDFVRQTPAIADTPFILISGMSDTGDVVHGLELGASDYITKPFDRKLALARIRTQLTLKRLMDQHKRTIAELEQVQMMRDRFFHMASHDLKNPMNNIRIGQYLLRAMSNPTEETEEVLNNIEHALDTMNDIIHEFLDVAAIQGQALELEIEPVAVEDLMWEIVYQFNGNAEHKNIALVVRDASGVVRADSRRLAQSLTNLVSNAVKYSPFDTQVTMWTEERAHSLRILVRDQGPGIPAGERDKLFSEFGKLSTQPTDGESRTGLGLWIVKQLAELQGGRVGAEFPAEGGSIFWIELPAEPEPLMVA